jgi:hypothetical protein
MNYCKYCGKELKENNSGMPKKFCNIKCSHKWKYENMPYYKARLLKASRKTYERLKNNPDFKKSQKEYFRKWLNKNRAHFNDLCRDRCREYERKKREYYALHKLCQYCGAKREEGYKSCGACLYKKNAQDRRERAERKRRGMCTICGKVKVKEFTNCIGCRNKMNAIRIRNKLKLKGGKK